MPLVKYFGFVGSALVLLLLVMNGSALVLLLLVMNWFLPEPASEPVHVSIERPVIRISSMETLPERMVGCRIKANQGTGFVESFNRLSSHTQNSSSSLEFRLVSCL